MCRPAPHSPACEGQGRATHTQRTKVSAPTWDAVPSWPGRGPDSGSPRRTWPTVRGSSAEDGVPTPPPHSGPPVLSTNIPSAGRSCPFLDGGGWVHKPIPIPTNTSPLPVGERLQCPRLFLLQERSPGGQTAPLPQSRGAEHLGEAVRRGEEGRRGLGRSQPITGGVAGERGVSATQNPLASFPLSISGAPIHHRQARFTRPPEIMKTAHTPLRGRLWRGL